MFRLTTVVLASALCAIATPLLAQTKVLPGDRVTMTATVEAVEQSTRMVTLRDEKGELRYVRVPDDVARFPQIKPGDTISATYYDTITLRVKAPGEKDVNTIGAGTTPGGGRKPAGTAATQQTITATITEIDMKVPSITFSGPQNWSYSTKVQDKQALSQVKVGDKVDITWTEALLVSFASPKK